MLRKLASALASQNTSWNIIEKTLLRLSRHLEYQRHAYVRRQRDLENEKRVSEFIHTISPDLSVLHGPFAGMSYPWTNAAGSAVIPKFLGSYEREISDMLESLLRKQEYDLVVDIGAAEGYYAVGIARYIPNLKVYAFDVDIIAQSMCQALAEANGVSDRVAVGGRCDREILRKLLLCERALLILDCEGGEDDLLTNEIARSCASHDLLVELHDDVVPGVAERIEALFGATHVVSNVPAVYDAVKARVYRYPELKGMTYSERRWALAENRSTGIEWFFLLSKIATK